MPNVHKIIFRFTLKPVLWPPGIQDHLFQPPGLHFRHNSTYVIRPPVLTVIQTSFCILSYWTDFTVWFQYSYIQLFNHWPIPLMPIKLNKPSCLTTYMPAVWLKVIRPLTAQQNILMEHASDWKLSPQNSIPAHIWLCWNLNLWPLEIYIVSNIKHLPCKHF